MLGHLRSPHAPVCCASFYRLEKKKLADTRVALQSMQREIAINDPKTASSLLDGCIGRQQMLEFEIGEAMTRQQLLESDARSFEMVLIDAAMHFEQAYLFVTAGIGKYAKHICDSWNCKLVTAGIGILLQLTYLYDT